MIDSNSLAKPLKPGFNENILVVTIKITIHYTTGDLWWQIVIGIKWIKFYQRLKSATKFQLSSDSFMLWKEDSIWWKYFVPYFSLREESAHQWVSRCGWRLRLLSRSKRQKQLHVKLVKVPKWLLGCKPEQSVNSIRFGILCFFVPAHSRFLRITFGAAPADLLAASMIAQQFLSTYLINVFMVYRMFLPLRHQKHPADGNDVFHGRCNILSQTFSQTHKVGINCIH